MTDRITPYEEGGNVSHRIDEIVMTGVDVHLEMLAESYAYLSITKGGATRNFAVFTEKGQLVVRMQDTDINEVAFT